MGPLVPGRFPKGSGREERKNLSNEKSAFGRTSF